MWLMPPRRLKLPRRAFIPSPYVEPRRRHVLDLFPSRHAAVPGVIYTDTFVGVAEMGG